MKKLVILVMLAACGGKGSDLAGVEPCLAAAGDAPMSASCVATVTAAAKHPKVSAKARAVLEHWLQLEASVGSDPRARAARDRQLEDVRTFALPELRAN
ncbi:MAG: hypothetical protein ABI867_34265 [Kofleriaceae bacterium]